MRSLIEMRNLIVMPLSAKFFTFILLVSLLSSTLVIAYHDSWGKPLPFGITGRQVEEVTTTSTETTTPKAEVNVNEIREEISYEAGLTPDSPLYFLDGFIDSPEEKLAEVKAMSEQGNIDAAQVAVEGYGENLVRLKNEIAQADNPDKIVTVGTEVLSHTNYITDLTKDLPPEIAEAIALDEITEETIIAVGDVEKAREEFIAKEAVRRGQIEALVAAKYAKYEKQAGYTQFKQEVVYKSAQEASAGLKEYYNTVIVNMEEGAEKERALEAYEQALANLQRAEEFQGKDFDSFFAGSSSFSKLRDFTEGEISDEELDSFLQELSEEQINEILDQSRMFEQIKSQPFYQQMPPQIREKMEAQFAVIESLNAKLNSLVASYQAQGLSRKEAFAKAALEMAPEFKEATKGFGPPEDAFAFYNKPPEGFDFPSGFPGGTPTPNQFPETGFPPQGFQGGPPPGFTFYPEGTQPPQFTEPPTPEQIAAIQKQYQEQYSQYAQQQQQPPPPSEATPPAPTPSPIPSPTPPSAPTGSAIYNPWDALIGK